ncbi:MAG: hypothetical protein ACXWQR_06160 [Ktedonobacterales bacterium]
MKTITLTNDKYAKLEEAAKARKTTPEALLADIVAGLTTSHIYYTTEDWLKDLGEGTDDANSCRSCTPLLRCS